MVKSQILAIQRLELTKQSKDIYIINSKDEKSDLQYICNPVPRCKCREGNYICTIANLCANLIICVPSVFKFEHKFAL